MSGSELCRILDKPEMLDALRNAADEGKVLEFLVHKNAPQAARLLVKEGKANLYYSPVPIEIGGIHFPKSDNYITYDGKTTLQLIDTGLNPIEDSFHGVNFFYQDMARQLVNRYPVSAKQIDIFYAMIGLKYAPRDIVSYLETGCLR